MSATGHTSRQAAILLTRFEFRASGFELTSSLSLRMHERADPFALYGT